MDFFQTLRMVLYRWKLFLLVFIVSLIGYFGVFTVLFGPERLHPLYVEPEHIHFTVNTLLIPSQDNQMIINTVVVFSMLNKHLSSDTFLELFPEDEILRPVINITVVDDSFWIIVSGIDLDVVDETTNRIISDINTMLPIGQNMSVLFYSFESDFKSPQEAFIELPIVPQPTRVTVGHARAMFISMVLALLTTLTATFARENLDKTIRSVYSLQKTTDIPLLPTLSHRPTESELLAFADALPKKQPIVLCSISQEQETIQTALKLAEIKANTNYTVVVLDFVGGAISNNPNIKVIPTSNSEPSHYTTGAGATQITEFTDIHDLVLFACPPVKTSGIAVALSQLAFVALLVKWGKDSSEALSQAKDCFSTGTNLGVTITSYKPNVQYIWEG